MDIFTRIYKSKYFYKWICENRHVISSNKNCKVKWALLKFPQNEIRFLAPTSDISVKETSTRTVLFTLGKNQNPISIHRTQELDGITADRRCELMAAEDFESDLDLAFNLQLQEAITASISASFSPPKSQLISTTKNDEFLSFTSKSSELREFEQELNDRAVSEAEFKRIRDDLHIRIHDHRVANEMTTIPEDQWQESGERFERPYGEGSSNGGSEEIFRVYAKGLVELYLPKEIILGGIGVAICDSKDELLFELRKPVLGNGMNRQSVEMKALIEGLNAAKDLGLNRVVFYCDYLPIFNYVSSDYH